MSVSLSDYHAMQARLEKNLPAGRAEKPVAVIPPANQGRPAGFRLVICGQIRGGKNNIIITRTGRRLPNPKWAAWRDMAVQEVQRQLPRGFAAFTQPVNVRLEYVAGDHRRRDHPAIVDAIWHVLEKAGVVTDDALLWPTESTRSYDKDSPLAIITFL